jgi:hypothetical protein
MMPSIKGRTFMPLQAQDVTELQTRRGNLQRPILHSGYCCWRERSERG